MKLTLCFFLAAFPLLAQTPPPADCQVAANVTVANGVGVVPVSPPAPTAYYDNRPLQCVLWMVWYASDSGLSGYTVAFQSATGSLTPGSFVSFAGNTITATSSFGTAAEGTAFYTSLSTTATTTNVSFVRVNASGASGTGNIHVTIQGWRLNWLNTLLGGSGGGGSGCVGTVMTPCVVQGPAGNGAAVAGNPVWICGTDGTDCRAIATDSSGDIKILGAVAPGSAAANPVNTGAENDSGNLVADHNFPDQADINPSAVTAFKVVAGSSGKLIYVGHISVSIGAGTTISIVQGTTTTTPCDTSQTTLFGPYANSVAVALDFTRDDPLQTTTTGDDLCLIFGASSTGGGGVKYSQR